MFKNLRNLLLNSVSNFEFNSNGNFTILFALTAPVLILSIGMGIDYKVAWSDKSRLDTAADAAAIAAVTTAKSYFAANSGILNGQALAQAAMNAGEAQALKVFAANMGSTMMVQPVVPSINMNYNNLVFNSTVTWSGYTPVHFGELIGINNISISGTSAATAALPKYLDFYVVVDTSGSMGIPTDANNQQLLIETNPDNPIERLNGYQGGCQFACHFQGYQGFNYTQLNNIPLKLNSVGAAVQTLLSTATSTAVIKNQYRIGIYPFIENAIQAAPLSSDFAIANNVAGNLAYYLDQGTSNDGMGSGGTHFETLWNDLSPYFQPAGTGLSADSTQPFMILVTDGVDNNQIYNPNTQSWTGSQPQIPPITLCQNAKNAGYTVAVILIPYVPIVDPETIWNDEDGVVNNLINTNSITPVMQECASPNYFFSAATSTDINNAMQTIFYQATTASRITQ